MGLELISTDSRERTQVAQVAFKTYTKGASIVITSGKHVRAMNTPLNPTFI